MDDISLLKASWYLRLSTSFFIWGTSHSSMASGASEVASVRLEDIGRKNSVRGLPACNQPPDVPSLLVSLPTKGKVPLLYTNLQPTARRSHQGPHSRPRHLFRPTWAGPGRVQSLELSTC